MHTETAPPHHPSDRQLSWLALLMPSRLPLALAPALVTTPPDAAPRSPVESDPSRSRRGASTSCRAEAREREREKRNKCQGTWSPADLAPASGSSIGAPLAIADHASPCEVLSPRCADGGGVAVWLAPSAAVWLTPPTSETTSSSQKQRVSSRG